ncbi:hypothetical protein OH77DRAFT_631025 [Trametes cingulata]|nr:hypothetical protein OH77DRAFT_631025 [Trametes cingulata]
MLGSSLPSSLVCSHVSVCALCCVYSYYYPPARDISCLLPPCPRALSRSYSSCRIRMCRLVRSCAFTVDIYLPLPLRSSAAAVVTPLAPDWLVRSGAAVFIPCHLFLASLSPFPRLLATSLALPSSLTCRSHLPGGVHVASASSGLDADASDSLVL